ncbi:hypothetical protein PWEIH_00485 [Listeria weihenstephanensis FSL R9-0317]|uniref:Pentapeptide repeat-containing protein n=1 Tax=Listeria weihenstephanensis TaxID=1006155 RepID=A0A3B6XH92_9LIST|nr:pentapeptide repeat-containing protein [Listeria weihenstephanensis]AQY50479.1 hypothetical protein UE46_05180 [Listeria phage LWP01] [Listeria weihenstephanensis]AQY52622.1 hypothetical protein UE46_p05180 [Listeria phage LWP01]EUJ41495.1 hypothetical protein PWEIH_00485 [Listeria weihenstephanensis FSL R9-0317]
MSTIKLSQEEVDFKLDLGLGFMQIRDLYGYDLSGVDFSNRHLENVSFTDSILTGAIFTGVTFGDNVLFWDTDIEGAVNLDLVQVKEIGSRNGTTTYIPYSNRVCCGCFEGTLEEFEETVQVVHKCNPQFLKEYSDAIAQFKAVREERKTNEGQH